MRSVDWSMAIALRNHWKNPDATTLKLCPLLADVDRMLAYMDSMGLTPGHVIDPCPECGEEHRWALLRLLLEQALEVRPPSHSPLLSGLDECLESVRSLNGGKEGYREMRKEAEKAFARVNVKNVYTL